MATYLIIGGIVLFIIAAVASGISEPSQPITVTITPPNPSASLGDVMLALMGIAGLIALFFALTG